MYRHILSSINALSAEEDRDFHKHLISTKFLKRLFTEESDIIFGTKGVGKTALSRALTELNTDMYYSTISIDLDSISFEAVYKSLTSLNSTVNFEMHNLARATWKNILLNYALIGLIKKLSGENALRRRIEKCLKEEKFLTTSSPNEGQESLRVLNAIENFFNKIISLPFPETKTLGGVTVEQQDVINKFPLNEKIGRLLPEVEREVRSKGKKIIVCIDGFDSIIKHTSESREAIFAGLIDAIYFFRLTSPFKEIFCFKGFLPQELTLEANRITWDGDKHSNNVHYISWELSDFENFIEKRFGPFSKKKRSVSKFADLWNEFLPERLVNPVHNIEENTFDYILRHTLCRPRQVLNHISHIIRRWSESPNAEFKIQSSFIPAQIGKNNKIMASKVSDHLSHIYPNIASFLKSWQGSSTIITVAKFKDKIFRYLVSDNLQFNHSEVDKIFDELFDFGIFGIQAPHQDPASSKRVRFMFSFVGDNVNSTVHNFVKDDDLMAFAPMFREYCGCNSSPDGIIVPIALDDLI